MLLFLKYKIIKISIKRFTKKVVIAKNLSAAKNIVNVFILCIIIRF